MSFFKKKTAPLPEKPKGRFTTDTDFYTSGELQQKIDNAIRATPQDFAMDSFAMDACSLGSSIKDTGTYLPLAQFAWYAAQGFIGYQACSIMSQHWLINKACTQPAMDAIRQGYKIEVKDGSPELIQEIADLDHKYKIVQNLLEFERLSRVFGIRIALFKVESDDPDYYKKPFNIDGVTEGSYKGIAQIDPQWCTPQLDTAALVDPTAIDYYEPSYWLIGSKLIHKSHLVINRPNVVPDYLKASYRYGGVSIPQRIYERVYAAERTANEAPMLAMTKRTDVLKTDASAAMSDRAKFEGNMRQYVEDRDNYGVKIIDSEDEMTRLDTALADLDVTIMTQYQLVAAASNVPATKLLGTQPKGFNSTGEYEQESYREELESIQTHNLNPLLERHYAILAKAELAKDVKIIPVWNALDSPTEAEWAAINLQRAQAAQVLHSMGAIDGRDERQRIMDDPDSGYAALEQWDDEADPLEGLEDDPINQI